ncbi:MAG TPA: hypothetical protein VL484_03875 [Vicinamibacterales bacterium]|jgi:hypothetical protein|nr:hypothetical protein [Vicinamibacterales bacterium]
MTRVGFLLVVALTVTGCGPQVDLKTSLQVADVLGGYYDAGVVDGRNKIVPSITFTLQKNTTASIHPLQLNVYFRQLPLPGSTPAPSTTGETDWEDVFIQNVDFHGDKTEPLTVRPKVGYTGDPPQTRADMLKNSHFQDIRVHVYAKHSSSQWIEIGVFDLPRHLLTPQR